MASSRGHLLVLALLLAVGDYSGSTSSHSVRNFYTAVSEPGQELPRFIVVGYVDDELIYKYDSHTKRKVLPQVPWMEKAGKDDPKYWEWNTQNVQNAESLFRVNLETLRGRYNQSRGGLHTWQWMYGCEMGPDKSPRGGFHQYAYDGEDFLALDKDTLTWTACVPQALPTKQKFDRRLDISHHHKDYLEQTCIDWLRKYLDYGQETLLRTERPTARVARKKSYDGQETLFCQLYGFYPKEIEVTWMTGGEDQKAETFTGGVVPNSDGTYHTWISIEVDPKEKDRYRCRVEHDSLQEPLELAWTEPASNVGLIVGVLAGVLLAVILLGAGIAFYMRKRQVECYKAASKKHPIENGFTGAPKKHPIENGYIAAPKKQSIENGYIAAPKDDLLRLPSITSRDSGHISESVSSGDSHHSSDSFSSRNSDTESGISEALLKP